MFDKLQNWIGGGSSGGTGGSGLNNGQIDWTITAEGTQSLSDMGWKRKENKYLGINNLSEKETKDNKELK